MTTLYESFYLLSNACTDTYDENSLIKFKTQLPKKFETERYEGLEIAVSSIGLSNNFKNIKTPPNNLPSFIITNCFKTAGLCQTEDENTVACDLPDDFDTNIDLLISPENTNYVMGKHEFDFHGGITTDCKWWAFNFEEKYYSADDLKDFFRKAATKIKQSTYLFPILEFTDDYCLEIKAGFTSSFWFLMHKSMVECFNFENKGEFIKSPTFSLVQTEEKEGFQTYHYVRKHFIKNEEYYVYQIRTKGKYGDNQFLTSSPAKHILEKKFPSVIRVLSENISAQIYNGSFSKDLIVYCPDFEKHDVYSYTEFKLKQFVPISNTILDTFSINIVDENNKPIQLLPGPATFIKMDLRNRFLNKQTSNHRLSSVPSDAYPDNNNSIFKVNLEAKKVLNRNYRVALTSISHPNVFSTFLRDESTRSFIVRELSGAKRVLKLILSDEGEYTEDQLIGFINTELKKSGIGSVEIQDNRCSFKFEEKQIFIRASNNVLNVLGYDLTLNKRGETKIFIVDNKNAFVFDSNKFDVMVEMREQNLKFGKRINLTYLKPHYIMVYTNIVSKSIVGGTMSNILKVVPIKNVNDYYVIADIQHKDYYELQNTEIDTIEVQLRSHDGEPINFASDVPTILNLEFSNKLEITT